MLGREDFPFLTKEDLRYDKGRAAVEDKCVPSAYFIGQLSGGTSFKYTILMYLCGYEK